ncbi:tumor necrosis factor receptor superfamily member 3-like [Stegastes partitus]|uniref:Tumor necrosis factor receptor superfamily member 3-like n=1 Tax=Stegastes partitus TaxID=144197 RepID=A0A3B4ZF69_9TELE|nr:PREDICTED: tumor necrosis factor receptor superfamily member 3-like [Stegastes partitus]
MVWQKLALAVCLLAVWTVGHARDCGDGQIEISGQCCNTCPPGTYMEKFCSDRLQSVCSPCPTGHFSDQHHTFDRCEPCRVCQQENSEKCTATTDATCSCRSGFLCSDSICSSCEEDKCVTGEERKRIDVPSGAGLMKYSYQCEPLCSEHAYFDTRDNTCKPRIECSAYGLAERFPGNKTHNSVCDKPDMRRDDGSTSSVILGVGFVSLSVVLLLFLSYTCVKNQRKHTENRSPVRAASTNHSEFHLSKEESGLHLISQAESKDSNSLDQVHLEQVTSC